MSCIIKADSKLTCFEEIAELKMEIDLVNQFNVQANKWYYLVVDSKEKYHRMTIFDQTWNNFVEVPIVSTRPISLGNINVNIGLKYKQVFPYTGFKGYLKEFKLFRKMW